MFSSTQELVDQLADVAHRNAAREELVRSGVEATPFLLRAAPKDDEHYKTILRTLLQIRDPHAAEGFRRALKNADEEIRAIGARGLYLVNAPDALSALQATINDCPDPLHYEQTPAVQSFIELGRAGLPAVFMLMDSSDEQIRRRGYYVLVHVVLQEIHRQLESRHSVQAAQQEWQNLQNANGSYQWDAPESLRRSSLELWKRWYAGTQQ
jgi:hypothetical protein